MNKKIKKTLSTLGVAGLVVSIGALMSGCKKQAKSSCGQGSCASKDTKTQESTTSCSAGSCGKGSCGQ